MEFSFIHTADIHLDAPFAGLYETDEEIADLVKAATFTAFDNIVDECVKRRVDFLLVAGDVYDESNRSLAAQLAFREGLKKLSDAGIRSYVTHGNHDPLNGWSSTIKWPELSHIFNSPKVTSVVFSRDGEDLAVINGASFKSGAVEDNIAIKFKANGSGLFQIGVLHCHVGAASTGHKHYAPCSLDDLKNSGMDYWALGHIHRRNTLHPAHPTVIYPGNTQGRNIKEVGPRGCYHVKVSGDGEVETEFVATDCLRWRQEEMDMRGLANEEELIAALNGLAEKTAAESDGRPALIRVTLTGRCALHPTLRRAGYLPDLLAQVREFGKSLTPLAWTIDIEDGTRPEIDTDSRRRANDIVADILNLADEYRHNPELLQELSSQFTAGSLDNKIHNLLGECDEKQTLAIIDEAQSRLLDYFIEGGE